MLCSYNISTFLLLIAIKMIYVATFLTVLQDLCATNIFITYVNLKCAEGYLFF